MQHLLDLTREQLAGWLDAQGFPRYRAGQVCRWVFASRAGDFDRMSDLPEDLRVRLAKAFRLQTTCVVRHRQASDGTEKLLLELADGRRVECVLLRDDRRRTVCISTQVGCAMGCVFCASGLDGVERNLTRGEILEQILRLKSLLGPDERLSHVVVMGMGEPLANLDNLLPALAVVADPQGLGISVRRITISTVGLPQAMRRLADAGAGYHLAVSLHAADDPLRNELVPANRKIGIDAVLAAADDFFQRTGRRVTFEYVLLAELNDRPRHARRLAARLAGRPALVNVIPYNPVAGLPYRAPRPQATARFVELLESAGLKVKVRYRKGDRIDAACGQLRRQATFAED